MKNIEKYNFYAEMIDRVINEYCMSFFPNGLPEYFYDIGTNFKEYEYGSYIRQAKVTGVDYYTTPPLKPCFDKRPTNKQIETIKENAESLTLSDLEKANIRIHVEARDSYGKVSWAMKYEDIENGNVSANKNNLEKVLQEKIQHYKDFYLVKENQFACAYCRKATDNDKKVTSTIISRQYPNFRKNFDYCSETCATHDQMAHEG